MRMVIAVTVFLSFAMLVAAEPPPLESFPPRNPRPAPPQQPAPPPQFQLPPGFRPELSPLRIPKFDPRLYMPKRTKSLYEKFNEVGAMLFGIIVGIGAAILAVVVVVCVI